VGEEIPGMVDNLMNASDEKKRYLAQTLFNHISSAQIITQKFQLVQAGDPEQAFT
jgi:hypothetical protein